MIQVLTQIKRSSHDPKDLNPYDEEMDGKSRKQPEHEHDNEGRKDKRDLRTKFTEDPMISQVMLEVVQDCVEATEKYCRNSGQQ